MYTERKETNLRMMLEISGYTYTGALVHTSVEVKPITKRFLQLSSSRYDWSCSGPLAGVKDMRVGAIGAWSEAT
jgi:hypothetical protein